MNNSGCTCGYNSPARLCCRHLYGGMTICVRVYPCVFLLEDKEVFCEKGQSAYMPVCVVVCRINRQQLWFILYSQCRGPLYLTGKVKAYSLEAVLQRSTCSLGMRNRTIERKTEKICTPLLSSACILPLTSWKHTLHCLQPRPPRSFSVSFLPLSSYHPLPAIPPISHAIKIADLDKAISRDLYMKKDGSCTGKWWWVTKGNCKQRVFI